MHARWSTCGIVSCYERERQADVEHGFYAECALGREKRGGRFMSVHVEFRVIFPEFFQLSGRFSKAFYMLVIETHKTQFTTIFCTAKSWFL